MVSFRNSQFRAILSALILSDALSHRQLGLDVTASPVRQTLMQKLDTPFEGAVQSDRWCREIGQSFHSLAIAQGHLPDLTPQANSSSASFTGPSASDRASLSDIERLLISLPVVLGQLDRRGAAGAASAHPAQGEALFYDCLVGLLNRQIASVAQRSQTISSHSDELASDPLASGIALALQQVLKVQGDFELSLRQSLQASSTMLPGLPLLVGVLSASWVGMAGIPAAWMRSLKWPDPTFAEWLHYRWQITGSATIKEWSWLLWQQWSGCSNRAVLGSITAVRPALLKP